MIDGDIKRCYLDSQYMIALTKGEPMQLFDKLGFKWDRSTVPADMPASVDRAIFRYKQMLAQFVFDASSLEGNPFTFPEVKTLLDGVTVGGHKLTAIKVAVNG